MVVSAGASVGGGAVAAAASVPVLLGTTEAYIGSNANFAIDAHAGTTFATVVNSRNDVEVAARAEEQIITVGAGLAGAAALGIAGSGAVLVIDTDTLAAISGDVQVTAGGNVLVAAQDDSTTYTIAGAVGVGIGGAGAGAVAVTVITKHTEAVIGGGAVVDADGNGSTLLHGIPTGAMNADGSFPTGSIRGVAVQARSSEDVLALGASGAGGLLIGAIAGAISVEVIDSDTLAHIIGGAEVNQNNAGSANPEQSVNVSAVNQLDVLSIDGSLGVGLGAVGVGASVDVGVIRNDTTAVIGGAGTKVRARDAVDVNALSRRDLSSNSISAPPAWEPGWREASSFIPSAAISAAPTARRRITACRTVPTPWPPRMATSSPRPRTASRGWWAVSRSTTRAPCLPSVPARSTSPPTPSTWA